ncbi:hypothetical protein VIGAN_08239800, partial [Vigna angularis var. angularis]
PRSSPFSSTPRVQKTWSSISSGQGSSTRSSPPSRPPFLTSGSKLIASTPIGYVEKSPNPFAKPLTSLSTTHESTSPTFSQVT